jgi:hypothetical protein
MELFVAICIDHHIDEIVRVFSTAEMAIEYCKEFVPDHRNLEVQKLSHSMIRDGWIFYATYGENDSVRVEKTVLNSE